MGRPALALSPESDDAASFAHFEEDLFHLVIFEVNLYSSQNWATRGHQGERRLDQTHLRDPAHLPTLTASPSLPLPFSLTLFLDITTL